MDEVIDERLEERLWLEALEDEDNEDTDDGYEL